MPGPRRRALAAAICATIVTFAAGVIALMMAYHQQSPVVVSGTCHVTRTTGPTDDPAVDPRGWLRGRACVVIYVVVTPSSRADRRPPGPVVLYPSPGAVGACSYVGPNASIQNQIAYADALRSEWPVGRAVACMYDSRRAFLDASSCGDMPTTGYIALVLAVVAGLHGFAIWVIVVRWVLGDDTRAAAAADAAAERPPRYAASPPPDYAAAPPSPATSETPLVVGADADAAA